MQRRDMLGCLGAGAFVATTGLARAGADDKKEHTGQGVPKEPRISCYEQCAKVADLCLYVATDILRSLVAAKGDGESLAKIHKGFTECREFCGLAHSMVLRESAFAKEACSACAEACSRCADICEKGVFESRDQVVKDLRECAEICRKVAQA